MSSVTPHSPTARQTTTTTHEGRPDLKSVADVTTFVDDLLNQMQSRFDSVGNNIMGRMNEMGKRMDELERSIEEIMDQAGLDKEAFLGNNQAKSPSTAFSSTAKAVLAATPTQSKAGTNTYSPSSGLIATSPNPRSGVRHVRTSTPVEI